MEIHTRLFWCKKFETHNVEMHSFFIVHIFLHIMKEKKNFTIKEIFGPK